MCTGSRLALLLKYADRTQQHKPLSTTEGRRVAFHEFGGSTEIRAGELAAGDVP